MKKPSLKLRPRGIEHAGTVHKVCQRNKSKTVRYRYPVRMLFRIILPYCTSGISLVQLKVTVKLKLSLCLT